MGVFLAPVSQREVFAIVDLGVEISSGGQVVPGQSDALFFRGYQGLAFHVPTPLKNLYPLDSTLSVTCLLLHSD